MRAFPDDALSSMEHDNLTAELRGRSEKPDKVVSFGDSRKAARMGAAFQ
jgi:hypothetical protein